MENEELTTLEKKLLKEALIMLWLRVNNEKRQSPESAMLKMELEIIEKLLSKTK